MITIADVLLAPFKVVAASGQNIAKTNGIAESGVKVDFDAATWPTDLDGAIVFAAILLASLCRWENSRATATGYRTGHWKNFFCSKSYGQRIPVATTCRQTQFFCFFFLQIVAERSVCQG